MSRVFLVASQVEVVVEVVIYINTAIMFAEGGRRCIKSYSIL